MSLHAKFAAWSGAVLLAVMIGACAEADNTVGPSEPTDGPMLSGGPTPMFRMTGGGRIDDPDALLKDEFFEPGICEGPSFVTFGFEAGPGRNGDPRGTIQWNDHCRHFRIHGYDITSYQTISGSGAPRERGCAVWEGPARLNGHEGFHFRIEPACDEGEPGWRDPRNPGTDLPDWIAIELIADDGTVIYLRHGLLSGGNIQTHLVR